MCSCSRFCLANPTCRLLKVLDTTRVSSFAAPSTQYPTQESFVQIRPHHYGCDHPFVVAGPALGSRTTATPMNVSFTTAQECNGCSSNKVVPCACQLEDGQAHYPSHRHEGQMPLQLYSALKIGALPSQESANPGWHAFVCSLQGAQRSYTLLAIAQIAHLSQKQPA